MNLRIDWTRCDGHGACAALLPQRIALDEWGFPLIQRSDIAPAQLDDVRRAIRYCPALALRVDTR